MSRDEIIEMLRSSMQVKVRCHSDGVVANVRVELLIDGEQIDWDSDSVLLDKD